MSGSVSPSFLLQLPPLVALAFICALSTHGTLCKDKLVNLGRAVVLNVCLPGSISISWEDVKDTTYWALIQTY